MRTDRHRWRQLRNNETRALRKLESDRRLKTSKSRKLLPVLALLETRRGLNHDDTRKLLEDMGHIVVWRRFLHTGGVGSFYWLSRKKIYRIQVFAAVCGMNHSRTPRAEWKKYYRYAWCIEI